MNFQKVKISNKLLYGMIIFSVLIIVGIMIPWFSQSPPIPDPCNQFMCDIHSSYFFVSFGYLIFIMLVCTLMAFIARDVPSVAGESGSILYSSLFTLFSMAFVTMIFAALSNNIDSQITIWLLAFVVMWISIIYICLIIFRKFKWINHTQQQIGQIFLSDKTSNTQFHTQNDNSDITNNEFSEKHEYRHEKEKANIAGDSFPQDDNVLVSEISVTMPQQSEITEPVSTSQETTISDISEFDNRQSICSAVSQRPESLKFTQNEIEDKINTGFKIAEMGDWEEYVDRDSGDSFWVNKQNNELTYVTPVAFNVLEEA